MTIELRDLRWAIVASRHRSLRQAAEELNVRQSTLSRCMRDLENCVGFSLFERTNGGTRTTIAGQDFLEAARRIVKQTDTVIGILQTRCRGESGRLVIGVHTSCAVGNLRATLMEHRRRFPNVQFQIVDGSSDQLISELADSGIDIAFVTESKPRWHDKILPLWSERVVAAVPEDHLLTSQESVTWTDLANEVLLVPHGGPGPEFLQVLTSKVGCLDPRRILRQDAALDRVLTLVAVGQGICLALEGATGVAVPGVVFREILDGQTPTRMIFFAYWQQTNGNSALHLFLDVLRERFPDLSVPPSSV